MADLNQGLAALRQYRQFITYNANKIPLNPLTGQAADAHNPAIWTDYETALLCAPADGGVGFVLTDSDPFFCLDIDKCSDGQNWSPLALELIAQLPGAAVEISRSGRGLHIWGTGALPVHSTRAPGLELYHTGRYIALGPWPELTRGDCRTDCSAALPGLVARYFAPGTPAAPAVWNDGPVPEWRGSISDEDLIRRAMLSKSSGNAFGNRASFAELWTADVYALARAYPSVNGEYDASAADAALAQHLAFWTGKDSERMLRLMRQSALVREKWEREDYLPRTITGAVSMQREVCQDKPVAQPAREVITAPTVRTDETFLNPDAQIMLFTGCAYVMDAHKMLIPGGDMLGREQFDAVYGGFIFGMDATNEKTSRSAWECFTQSRALRFPKVQSTEFQPARAPGEIWTEQGRTRVNSYVPIETPRRKGDASPFLTHMAKLLPHAADRASLLAWMAAAVQHPGVKFQWAPLIQGTRGNGKTTLSRCLQKAIGYEHCHPVSAKDLTGKFNSWMDRKLLITVEDIRIGPDETGALEALKPMLTSDWLEIEHKGQDKIARRVYCNFIFNANEKDALRKTPDNRSLAVYYCAQQTVEDLARDVMDNGYFARLYDWFERQDGYAIVNDFLRSYQIPDELNPAKLCLRAPGTSSTDEAIALATDSATQELQEAIDSERPGFKGGWISAYHLDRLLRETGNERAYPRNKRRDLVRQLGYDLHPGLPLGQAVRAIGVEGRTRLYIKVGTDGGLAGMAAQRAYEDAQAVAADVFKAVPAPPSVQPMRG